LSDDSLEWRNKVKPYLQEILLHAKEATGRRIGFYGDCGVGKSSLLNAILGVKLLPTAMTSTCTAAVLEITAWSKPFYHAHIFFIPQPEWDQEVEMAHDLLKGGPEEEADERLQSMLEKIHSLCKGDPDRSHTWELNPEQRKLLTDGSVLLHTDKPSELAKLLQPYVHAAGELWPLVDQVYIQGPFKALSKLDISLLNIPGINNSYSSMKRHSEEALDGCDAVFFMPLLGKVGTPATSAAVAQLGLVPRVGIVVTRLAEYLEEDSSPPLSQVSSVLKDKINTATANARHRIPAMTPVYCMELHNPTCDQAAVLQLFISTELRAASTMDTSTHACQLQNDLNRILVLFQEAVLNSSSKRAEAKQLLNATGAALKIKKPADNPHLQLFMQPNADVVLAAFTKLRWNAIKQHIREGQYEGHIDHVKLQGLDWTDLDPANKLPELATVFRQFQDLVASVEDSTVAQWQRQLKDARKKVLDECKVLNLHSEEALPFCALLKLFVFVVSENCSGR
jgi:GTPase SAR1 family protein